MTERPGGEPDRCPGGTPAPGRDAVLAEARATLDAAGQLPDDEIDIAAVALQFARADDPDIDLAPARAELSSLARDAVRAADEDDAADDPQARRAVLARLIHGQRGFGPDLEHHDDPDNASLPRVIARRRGLQVAIGILWLHAAEAAGWEAHGLDFPGHFLLALAGPRGPAVVDPYGGGAALDAADLRRLIKRVEGEGAELRPGLLAPMDKRAVLLRLRNNVKLRLLRLGRLPEALDCAADMLRLAPGHAALWRETGVMHARLGHPTAAIRCLGRFVALVPDGEAAERARQMIDDLRQRLN